MIEDTEPFLRTALAVCEAGRFLYGQGWNPATSGNFSARVDQNWLALTTSGKHKGRLEPDDMMAVTPAGDAADPHKKPSAEMLLHTVLYQRDPQLGAVLHTHSPAATVLSMLDLSKGRVVFEGFELQKALPGIITHESRVEVPIFANTQDMIVLSKQVAAWLREHPETSGFLIAGHGFYTWGADLDETLRHMEAYEFLFACELDLRRLRT